MLSYIGFFSSDDNIKLIEIPLTMLHHVSYVLPSHFIYRKLRIIGRGTFLRYKTRGWKEMIENKEGMFQGGNVDW
jgi:hypothetical protein